MGVMKPGFGSKIYEFDLLESTNEVMKDMIHEGLLEAGTVIRSNYQTKGRGQRGTSWDAEADSNLLFSVQLTPNQLRADQQFVINEFASLALWDVLYSCLPDHLVEVKWPNDLLVDGKKVAGMLVENSLKGSSIEWSILGIGINVNQLDFKQLPKAGSIALFSGKQVDREEIFQEVLKSFDRRWKQLESGENLRREYAAKLYGYKLEVPVVIEGKEGKLNVQGLDSYGRLEAKWEGETRVFDLKEISFEPILGPADRT